MHKLEQDAWVRASELKSLHKEHETLVDDNKRLMQQTETLRVAKDRLIEEKTSVMMRLAEVESELKKTGTEVRDTTTASKVEFAIRSLPF